MKNIAIAVLLLLGFLVDSADAKTQRYYNRALLHDMNIERLVERSYWESTDEYADYDSTEVVTKVTKNKKQKNRANKDGLVKIKDKFNKDKPRKKKNKTVTVKKTEFSESFNRSSDTYVDEDVYTQDTYYFHIIMDGKEYITTYEPAWFFSHKPAWVIGDPIQVRLNNKRDRMYLLRQDGKELKTKVFKVSRLKPRPVRQPQYQVPERDPRYQSYYYSPEQMDEYYQNYTLEAYEFCPRQAW